MKRGPIKILAVDDQPANLIALEAILSPNYEILTATSGAEALSQLERHEFAAILLDVQMPILDGFATARLIREQGVRTPIIFLTAISASESHAMRGYEAGAVDYLYKPLNPDILKAKIDVFAELFEKTREIERQSRLLREDSDRRYRDLMEGIPNGVVWTAEVETGRITFVSAAVEQISGYAPAAFLREQTFFTDHSLDGDGEAVKAALKSARETGRDAEFEHRLRRADGRELWLHTKVRVTDREFRGLSIDISRLKQTESSLREMIMIRDEFLSIASHELKTPLTPLQLQIEGFRRLWDRGQVDKIPADKFHRMLDVSLAQINVLSGLVDQLVDVSRIKAGRLTLNRGPVDLVVMVRKVVEMFRDNLALEKVALELHLPESLVGDWDGPRIEQVIMNLLSNALKYGLDKPVRIDVARVDDRAILRICDQGIGIPAPDQARIFRRFERAVSANHYSGLGMGLYISQQITELHDGKIQVRSAPNQGAEFTLELPL